MIAVSDYLRRELEAKIPEARGKTEVVDSGVDLERFPVLPAPDETPAFVCIGSLTDVRTSSASPRRSSASARGR